MSKEAHAQLLALLPDNGAFFACTQGYVRAAEKQSKRGFTSKLVDDTFDLLGDQIAKGSGTFASGPLPNVFKALFMNALSAARLGPTKRIVKLSSRRPDAASSGIATDAIQAAVTKWTLAQKAEKAERAQKKAETASQATNDSEPANADPSSEPPAKRAKITEESVTTRVATLAQQECCDQVVSTWTEVQEYLTPARLARLKLLVQQQ